MLPLDDRIFKNDDDYYESIGNGIWLMDNHKWSFVVWNRERNKKSIYQLVHVDYHWDAGYDYWDSPNEEKIFLAASDREIISIVREENHIRYDSFICPAIAKGFIDEVHFYCLQGDDGGDVAIYKDFLDKYSCTQILHDSTRTLSKLEAEKPMIFDFCIDVFNKSTRWYESDIWPDDEIDRLLQDCEHLVKSAEIVTVSMSYGYSGTENDTRRLTQKVIEVFSTWREAS